MAPQKGAGMKRGSGQGWMFTMLVEMGGDVSHSQSKNRNFLKAFPAFIPACYLVVPVYVLRFKIYLILKIGVHE